MYGLVEPTVLLNTVKQLVLIFSCTVSLIRRLSDYLYMIVGGLGQIARIGAINIPDDPPHYDAKKYEEAY